MKTLENYIINEDTLIIEPCYENNVHQSKITERDQVIYSEQKPIDIVNYSCLMRGFTTMDGRRKAMKFVTNKQRKLPIPIDQKDIVFIPTKAEKDYDCAWLSFKYIDKVVSTSFDETVTVVIFTNGHKVKLQVSLLTMQRQIHFAGYIYALLNK
ncbi:competence protein ComK [Halalkalibacillus halophilus]|uniref:competence protein ComK n=1 Tax=Halalkalibacillus halophilus TaxID=392827 RepID=UPI00042423FE|nr:competence protein ComK [Halalkalibacillus halophilus]